MYVVGSIKSYTSIKVIIILFEHNIIVVEDYIIYFYNCTLRRQ